MHRTEISRLSDYLALLSQNISPFNFFDFLFILFAFELETVDVPFWEQGYDLGIVKGCSARIECNNMFSRGKCRKLTARWWYWKQVFGSSCI